MKLNIIKSKNTNIYNNLAIEEYLLNQNIKDIFLFFWKAKDAVVIGKHQNPWREINFDSEYNFDIARRVSGGGAVYHDLGNLNYSVIAPKNYLNSDEIFEYILDALNNIGIDAYRNYKNDLMYKNYKFSGSAFCIKKNNFLHHGTLLINSNLEKIKDILKINPAFNTHATISKPSEIINLKDINYCIDEEIIINNIIRIFSKRIKLQTQYIETHYFRDSELIKKHKSWEWIYGRTPKFTIELENNIYQIENGYIISINGKILNEKEKFDFKNLLLNV
ncbi:lipoate--protein ligase family protein [Marinitoga litoralis]|uniref:lipoate--protein ligase family protein n=1 Tax=Marinitoga litoralis TaxID=570855 RepID=UPI001961F2E9|nr:lipoate--protein ligase family protein [Marinitoga litoralis]MBM7559222.1 lipoate-protein ligase A [Marinitoga litoralis]